MRMWTRKRTITRTRLRKESGFGMGGNMKPIIRTGTRALMRLFLKIGADMKMIEVIEKPGIEKPGKQNYFIV